MRSRFHVIKGVATGGAAPSAAQAALTDGRFHPPYGLKNGHWESVVGRLGSGGRLT